MRAKPTKTRGRLDATPWARAYLCHYGDLEDVKARVPPDHTLSISGSGPRGPWVIRLWNHTTEEKGQTFRDVVNLVEKVDEVLKKAER